MNAGDVIQGRYRLEEKLGAGGMATVWRAHDLRLERPVALKCLMAPLSEDPAFLVRFFSEAQQVAKLSHPNVIRVLDFGEGGECPYLVMEFVPGGSLETVTGTPMLPERALDLIAGAARGAGAAHRAGLVHRDLKPANIMLGEGDIPKVADFGIAVAEAQERFTATGTAIGSPHYVSPEQAAGRPVVPASDVYSLGVVLYELVTGRKPFEADNSTALAIAHVEKTPEPPSAHVPDLAPFIDELVMTCLAKDSAARFRSGDELATAIEAEDGNTNVFTVAPPAGSTAMGEPMSDDNEASGRGRARRVATVSLLAALFIGLLTFGVFALKGPDAPATDRAAAAVEPNGSVNSKESPSDREKDDVEDAGVESDVVVASSPSPSPTATESNEKTTETRREKTAAQEDSGDEEPVEEETEPTPEATTEPTSEPTEPAPEPTSSP